MSLIGLTEQSCDATCKEGVELHIFRVLSSLGEKISKVMVGGGLQLYVGCTFLGGSGGMPPRKFEPSEWVLNHSGITDRFISKRNWS